MTSRSSNIRKLAVGLSSSVLLVVAGVSAALAGDGNINDPWSHSTSLWLAPQKPNTAQLGEYTPPRVNRACPTTRPQLSEEAQHRNETGDVTIGVYVSTHGRPRKITVANSSGYQDLDNAAAAAAASWHYIPAMVGGAHISDWMAVRFHFAAQDASAKPVEAPVGNGACDI